MLHLRESLVVALLSAGFVLGPAGAADAQDDFRLTSGTCPVCSQTQLVKWQRVMDHQLGVAAIDPVGSYVGIWPAERFLSIRNNWYPQSTQKQTLCGNLAEYGFYDGAGDEADWNLHIEPASQFGFLFDEVARRHPPTDEWRGRQIEAEITPDEGFYENPWFSKSRGESDDVRKSPLEGQPFCAYGPWVGDKGHGFKPEIHPSELLWWRSGQSAYLLNMQDDSNRFQDESDFDLGGQTPPASWRPWARHPRTGRFDIAVSVTGPSPLAPTQTLPLTVPRLEIRTEPRSLIKPALNDAVDADNGTEHGLEYNGQLLLRANEGGPTGVPSEDNDIKVGFDFCRVRGGLRERFRDRLFGYVTLTTKVGDTGEGGPNGEGVHLLRVRRVESRPVSEVAVLRRTRTLRPGRALRVSAEPRWIRSSLRRVFVRGRPSLVADAEVTARPFGRSRPGDRAIVGGKLTSGRPAPQGPALRRGGTNRRVLVALQITSPARVTIKTQSGQRPAAELPAVAPLLDIQDPAPRSPGRAADPAMGATAVGAPGKALLGAQLVDQWSVKVRPAYAAVRDGRPSVEDDTPVAEVLTEVLAGGIDRRRELFGRSRPMPVRWSFRAINAVTRKRVAVRVDRAAGPGEVRVRRSRGAGASSELNVVFPNRGIYRLTARARTRDPFGKTATSTRRFSNLVLSGSSRTELDATALMQLEQLAGLAPGQLTAASAYVLDPNIFAMNRAARDAGAVQVLANDAARDLRISIEELDVLLRATNAFASRAAFRSTDTAPSTPSAAGRAGSGTP